ncbi:MAG: AmmeMemoRadiSam system radical SAM enzyme [Deltaproteobacteria bacterium]|jgi:pyruvate formate lyase activating enzyme|nr:AmmeMemoRadiSam system radical SAM enzyme [Deltaproteobacteria bacterium]
MIVEARLWEKSQNDSVICLLCSRKCHIQENKRGFCQVRLNKAGNLYSLNYGYTGAINLDPVEKKPLYHYQPGSKTFSIGAPGCNFDCLGCQNSSLSRPGDAFNPQREVSASPEDLVQIALTTEAKSLSFTYSEPTVFYEFAQDLGILGMEKGLKSIWVSNGYLSGLTLQSLQGVAAMNIDLKGFTDDFYREVTKGRLEPVKDTIKAAFEKGIFIELTTLLIPTVNDGEKELTALVEFIAAIDPKIPWHISAFHPLRKQSHLRPTSSSDLEKARKIGKLNGLKYIYLGNAVGSDYGDTFCPQCGTLLVSRTGFSISLDKLSPRGLCPNCGEVIPGVWS